MKPYYIARDSDGDIAYLLVDDVLYPVEAFELDEPIETRRRQAPKEEPLEADC
jgi:hypothetical protein